MQKNYLVAGLLLMTVLFVKGQNAVLKGVVTQKDTQQPLCGANVFFKGTTTGTGTNNKGEFQIKKLVPGEYDLIVSFSGFKRHDVQVVLNEGENTLVVKMEESENNLDEVVVTGTGTPHYIKTAPVPTELISKKAITTTGAAEFTELMLNISPSFDFNPSSMSSSMKLNGLSNDFILILIDGKRTYGDIGGNSDLNRINPDDIERIEVLKGAASLLYGSDAIAGVINIITKKSRQKINVSNATRIRNYQTVQQSNTLGINQGKFSWNGSFNHKSSDGWQLSKYEEDDDELVDTDAKAQNKYSDRIFKHTLSFRASEKLELYGGNSYYEKDIYRPLTVGKYGYYYEDYTYQAGAKYLLNEKDYVSLDYDYDNYLYYYKYNQASGDYVSGDKLINNDQRMSNVSLKYVSSLSENHTLSVGADYLYEKMVSENRLVDGEADVYTLSLYVQDEITLFEKLDLVAGLRTVKHKEFGNAFTPKISFLYKLDQINIRGTYGYGFKAPTLKELYYDYEKSGTVYMGNVDLDPQKSQYYSAGLDYHLSNFTISVNGYINQVDDLIDYQTIDLYEDDEENGISKRKQHYNVEESCSKGIDVLLHAYLGAGFTLGGGYSYVDAQNISDDEPLEGVANNYGNISMSYDHKWKSYHINANILGRMQGEKYYDDGNAKAYNLWKLTSNHRFTKLGSFALELQLGIDNIFDYVDDSPYGSNYGTINPGRTYFAGLIVNFSK
jgi:outer membrane receptor for ferrienterochelin and colicins